MSEYRVRWEIDVDADNAEAAARLALSAMTDAGTTATVFDVMGKRGRVRRIDLTLDRKSDPVWCVLLRLPEQDELDPCDRVTWNVKARSVKAAAAKARKELAKRYDCDPDDIGVRAVALGVASIQLPW